MSKGYVDADGHVMEDAEDILRFVRAPFNNRGTRNWIPSLDHFHTPADGTPRTPGTFRTPGRSNGWSSLKKPAPITRCSIRPRDWPMAMLPIRSGPWLTLRATTTIFTHGI